MAARLGLRRVWDITHPYRLTAWLAFGLLVQPAFARSPAFVGTGRLTTSGAIKAFGVSPDGTVVVGEAVDIEGNTQAFLWTADGGPRGIGFLSETNKETRARGVTWTLTGPTQIKICGTGKDDENNDQAFLWTGDASGAGTFELLPRLEGGTANVANALLAAPDGVVYVVGNSRGTASGDYWQAFRWRSDNPTGSLALGFLNSDRMESRATGIAWRDNQTHIVGYGWSHWDGGQESREAAFWTPGDGLLGDKGLTWVCGNEPWQILAGPDGVASTTAGGFDVQVTAPGTSGLDPDTVVASAGPDNVLRDQTIPASGDVYAPTAAAPLSPNESLYRGISPNGRYRVGRSNYIPGDNMRWEACLRDVKNRDYTVPDECGGIAFHWPLGFLTVDNDGSPIQDDYSEALAVSNGAHAHISRDGLVVVGSSLSLSDPEPRPTRAFICMIQHGHDIWFLRHQAADPPDYGARAASRFKEMRNLQWLLSDHFGLDLVGWDLCEATAVSADGTVVVGWGLHDGVPEGFIATIQPLPRKGACCQRPSLECTYEFEEDCEGDWFGPDSICVNCCPTPFADADQDGDVDMADFGIFQACLSTGYPNTILPGCECWDWNEDGQIDDQDFTQAFIVCGSGPGLPITNPDCQ